MQLTQKIRVFPSAEQIDALWHLSERCRLAYNFALSERITAWKEQGRSISYRKQQNDLPEIKKKYPEYKWVYSKALQMILRNLNADYKSFYSLRKKGHNDAKPPRYKGKDYFVTMTYNQSGFNVENNKITLSHFYNEVSLSFDMPEKFKFGKIYQISIYNNGDGFYLSVTYEVPEKPYEDNGLYQAIDLGITKTVTAVNMQGRFFEVKNPRPDKYWNKRTDAIQSKRDHCKKYSNRWKRLHKSMNKRKRKCSNQIKDFEHKLSRRMVDNTRADTIIIWRLNVKNMTQSDNATKGLNRSTQNQGYLSRFAGFLTYKAELVGKRVIEISEEKTSKTCCVCGKEYDMPIWERSMVCDCGNSMDRDRNSSVNIMFRFLSQNAKWTGYQQFADNLRQTGLDITMPRYSQEAPSDRVGSSLLSNGLCTSSSFQQ